MNLLSIYFKIKEYLPYKNTIDECFNLKIYRLLKSIKNRSPDYMHSSLLIFACNYLIDSQYVQNKALVSIKNTLQARCFLLIYFLYQNLVLIKSVTFSNTNSGTSLCGV